MKRIKCRILSLLLCCGFVFTACSDTTVTNNTKPNRVTIETTENISSVTEPITTDSAEVIDVPAIEDLENGNSGTADGEVVGAYDCGNFIMLPAEYNYNWTSRVVMPEDAKLKINVVTNLLDLVDEPDNTFVDITYNIDAACKKRINTNDITLTELFDGVVGIEGIYDKKDVIYYYLVFLTDEQGNDLEKPYVLPITVADIIEVPSVTFTADKSLYFSGDVEVMPISRGAAIGDNEAVNSLLNTCDEYIGIIPITVSYFDSIMTGVTQSVSAQDLKHYAKNDIAIVYRGVEGEQRSAWKYIDCSQFAPEIANSVVGFDNGFETKVCNAKTYTEFLDIMPQYMDVEFCDGEVRTVPVRYSFENNAIGYGVREPDLVMLETGCTSDIVLDCEAVPGYYRTSITFNGSLSKTEVTEWLSAATKRQLLYTIKTSPLQCVKTSGVDMTINDNSAVVLNIASMYKDIVLMDKVSSSGDNHLSFNFGGQSSEQIEGMGTDLVTSDNTWGGYEAGKSVNYEAKMGSIILNAEDSAQVLAAMHLIDTEPTFSIPISEFDSGRYKTIDDIVDMPYKVMLQNPLVAYILEIGCVVTKTEVIYTVRYIVDSETATAWQRGASAAAYELAVTLKSINDDSEKYSRLNTQLTVGAEYHTSFVSILKTVNKDWTDIDKTFLSLYTPYGLFTDNVAADYGYASAYKLVCDKAGLPCEIVQGTANGYLHTWNRVCVNNQWYNIDTAVNDVPVGVSELEREFRDRCLFVSDSQMEAMYKILYSEHMAGEGKDTMENISSSELSDYLLNADLAKIAKGEGALRVKLNDIPAVSNIRTISDSAYSVYIAKGGSVDIGNSALIYTVDGVICYAPILMLEKVVS